MKRVIEEVLSSSRLFIVMRFLVQRIGFVVTRSTFAIFLIAVLTCNIIFPIGTANRTIIALVANHIFSQEKPVTAKRPTIEFLSPLTQRVTRPNLGTVGPFLRPPYFSKNILIPITFKDVPLDRIVEIPALKFDELIMEALPRHMRRRLAPYLSHTLEMAEKYEVDPFWALSIMWTESHFNKNAKSYVNARGLMQVMPGTGYQLLNQLRGPIGFKKSQALVRDPFVNIELGIYYLSTLVEFFDGETMLSTVSYNMGPYGVKRRLRKGLPVGVKNLYLDKVTKNYKRVTAPYIKFMKNHVNAYSLASLKLTH
jgi:hypothetical protein